MDILINQKIEESATLDSTIANSWMQLVATPAQIEVSEKRRTQAAWKAVYYRDHPMVIKARELKKEGDLSLTGIARLIGIHAKAVHRWQDKGFLDDSQAA